MDDLIKIQKLTELYPKEMENLSEEFLLKLRITLWGEAAVVADKEKVNSLPTPSQQTKKRVKQHLSSLCEDKEQEDSHRKSTRKSKRSNAELLAAADGIVKTDNEIEVIAPVAAPRTLISVSESIRQENYEESNEINERKSEATTLMPPPPAPTVPASADETLNKRPQRAAKLKSEKNLKEPQLKSKLRRPTNDEVKIKLEHEQRPSQMHEAIPTLHETSSKHISPESLSNVGAKESLLSQKSDNSVVIIPGKKPSIVSINSDIEDASTATATAVNDTNTQTSKEQTTESNVESLVHDIHIKIKREKISLPNQEEVPADIPSETLTLPMTTTTVEETSLAATILSSTTNTTSVVPAKKGKKKKDVVHRPIKVERFSDLDPKPPSTVSSNTPQRSLDKTENIETSAIKETNRPASIYEDAVETPPSNNSKEINNATVNVGGGIVNETMNLGPTTGDATFCTNPAQTTFQVAPAQSTFIMDSNPNATITLNKLSGTGVSADATFDVQHMSKATKDKDGDVGAQRSFETAKDSSMPNDDDSLMTEEDEQEKPVQTKSKVSTTASAKTKVLTKTSTSAKAGYKMPTRTNELFDPLLQSPVKLRVEAFENARNKKENVTPSSATTPIIGKLGAPALGRFLTPTQSSNISNSHSNIVKKGTASATKTLPLPKSANAASLQRSNSTASTKTLQRENSGDDFRKGLYNLAEERKKQREQKHLLAAQQREAKERERAERMAKLAKEREEKRLLKKQQEREQEQKKRELEEIQRKLRQQQEEEAAKLKAAKEREMMKQQQLAKQKMMPPPPKASSKYTFEMLHEDDSTDDENKVSYKRPPPPSWSRSHVRGPYMLKQEYTPSAYIDSFFSVQPMTPDLKIIFPNIDARHLKRNSSVLWSTPPRYSELPKY
ncbi:uncharacterized protein ACRADG_011247 isoform 2-T2 [Cochliomyia hominivorax]